MSTLDDRLNRLFRTIDVAPDFEVRVMARVRAERPEILKERADSARSRAQQAYGIAGRELRQWRRAALRMLTLDALGGATLLLVLLAGLPRVAPQLVAYGTHYVLSFVAILALLVTAFVIAGPFTDRRTPLS